MPERLKILMKIFKISNNDLALLLQVDVSLVSKWRSGVRNMASNPEYVKKMVTYIMNLNKKEDYKLVREILLGEYKLVDSCTENDLSLLLYDWVCNPKMETERDYILQEMLKSKTLTKIEQMYFWDGNEGRREAVKYFTQYAVSCSPGAEIISYTTESNQWFHENKKFLELWMGMVHEFFEKGNIMKIIHPMNRNYYEIAASMSKWLPLHMSCEVKGYYLKKYDETDVMKSTILVLRGKMVLFSISTDKEADSCRTWSLHDAMLVNQFEAVVMRYLKESVPLFKRYTLDSALANDHFLEDMFSLYEAGSECYFYNDFNHMLPVSQEKRRKLFESASLSPEKISEILTALETIDTLKKDCECYFLIDLEVLHQWLHRGDIKTNILSLFAKEAVCVPNTIYAEGVMEFLEHAAYQKHIHIGLVDREMHEEFGELSICSGGKDIHTFITTYNTERTIALSIQEYTVAIALHHKMEIIWRSVPYLMKEKEYVVDYIKREINEMCNK